MQTIDLKVGRNILKIDEQDLILDNESCYQIITKNIRGYAPVMSKKLFRELQKKGFIYTDEKLKEEAEKTYNSTIVTYWKFAIDKMKDTDGSSKCTGTER